MRGVEGLQASGARRPLLADKSAHLVRLQVCTYAHMHVHIHIRIHIYILLTLYVSSTEVPKMMFASSAQMDAMTAATSFTSWSDISQT